MPTFLTEVKHGARIGQKAKGILLGMRRPDGLWTSCPEKLIELPYTRSWQQGQLLLVEIGSDGAVDEVVYATDKLMQALRDWSLKLAQFDSKKVELELQRESLQYQAGKFFVREQEIKHREDLLKQQERSLQTLLEKAQEKVDLAAKHHDALTEAWKHLHYREEQLKKD